MDAKLLIMTLVDVFQIEGRGTIITGTPGPQVDLVRRGLPLELDSSTHGLISTAVAELEMFDPSFSGDRPRPLGLMLTDRIPSAHLPKGTKVYRAALAANA